MLDSILNQPNTESFRPFTFGPENRLFGIHQRARGFIRRHGLLIAGPLLNEHSRSHSMLRRVAIMASKAGYDVLRFEYSGMGNSSGNLCDYDCSDWINDVEEASKLLYEVSDIDRLSAFSVRLSAGFVAEQSQSLDFEKFITWDPLYCGREWLASLDQSRRSHADAFPKMLDEIWQTAQGYQIDPGFDAAMASFSAAKPKAKQNIAIVSRDYPTGIDLSPLCDSITEDSEIAEWETRRSYTLHAHGVVNFVREHLL